MKYVIIFVSKINAICWHWRRYSRPSYRRKRPLAWRARRVPEIKENENRRESNENLSSSSNHVRAYQQHHVSARRFDINAYMLKHVTALFHATAASIVSAPASGDLSLMWPGSNSNISDKACPAKSSPLPPHRRRPSGPLF